MTLSHAGHGYVPHGVVHPVTLPHCVAVLALTLQLPWPYYACMRCCVPSLAGLSEQQLASLRSVPLVPVASSTVLVTAGQLFMRLPENLAPFAYEASAAPWLLAASPGSCMAQHAGSRPHFVVRSPSTAAWVWSWCACRCQPRLRATCPCWSAWARAASPAPATWWRR